MVRDLDIPARIEVLPTVREPTASRCPRRNRCLAAPERERAPALRRGLRAAAALAAAGERDAAALCERPRRSDWPAPPSSPSTSRSSIPTASSR